MYTNLTTHQTLKEKKTLANSCEKLSQSNFSFPQSMGHLIVPAGKRIYNAFKTQPPKKEEKQQIKFISRPITPNIQTHSKLKLNVCFFSKNQFN